MLGTSPQAASVTRTTRTSRPPDILGIDSVVDASVVATDLTSPHYHRYDKLNL